MNNTVNDARVMTPIDALMDEYYRPISPLLKMDGVTNIYVNRFNEVLYEQFGETKIWNDTWDNEESLQTSIKLLANNLEQPIDEAEPLLDAVMPDGSRLNAGLPPILDYSYVTIRVFPEKRITYEKLIEYGSLTREMYEYLYLSVLTKKNIVVAGGTGSGKTTLVQMLLDHIPDSRRLVVIEDTRELKTRSFNCLQLEAPKRKDQYGNQQKVTLSRLVVNALRQTPESLVVGEMRDGAAATAYRTLLNTGHSGIITTIHSDSAQLTINRLTDMVLEANPGLQQNIVSSGFMSSIGVIVYARNTETKGKRITTIAEVIKGEIIPIFEWDDFLEKHVIHEEVLEKSQLWNEIKRLKIEIPELKELGRFAAK